MSLYNAIFGVHPHTFLVYPTLGFGHAEDFPRFRNCWLKDDKIIILCRMGGGNNFCWNDNSAESVGNDEDRKFTPDCICYGCRARRYQDHELFLNRYDDDFDSTYCYFEFKLPEKWKADLMLLAEGKLTETSKEYQDLCIDTLKSEDKKEMLKKAFAGELNDDAGKTN